MSGPFETTSFSESSEFSSPEEMIEKIVISKEKKDKFYSQNRPSGLK